MKKYLIKFTSQSIKNLPGIPAALITILIFFNVLPKVWGQDLFWTDTAAYPSVATDGTWETLGGGWSSTPGTTNTSANWANGSVAVFQGVYYLETPGLPPVPLPDMVSTVTLGSPITAAGINFDPGAGQYSIDTNGNTLIIDGAGIVNNSGNLQEIVNNGGTAGGVTEFTNTSTVVGVGIENNGGTGAGTVGGSTEFTDASSAGSAGIVNNGGTAGGFTEFTNTSTAGSAGITNEGGTAAGTVGGFTEFTDTSTAGSATIENDGGTATGAGGGFTEFTDSSTAGSATIYNFGESSTEAPLAGAAAGFTEFSGTSTAGSATIFNAFGGITTFTDASTAGSATIENAGAAGAGTFAGFTEFSGTSTAGSATIWNFGDSDVGATAEPEAGFTEFSGTSTAGSATIYNYGGLTVNGFTEFTDASTAGSATITNYGGLTEEGATLFTGGFTEFTDASTAGSATIINYGGIGAGTAGGSTEFDGTSTAGSATITNNGGTAGGFTEFTHSSTAGSATITNNGGTAGGFTYFTDSSTAGSATIINNGGTTGSFTVSFVSPAPLPAVEESVPGGPAGGFTEFTDSSTAGNATIITNGGTGGGSGGSTFFIDSSDGGTARAITNGNGRFDISGLTTAGMGIGSIAGSGNYFLGSKTLTVGSNNLSTTVSGVIQDGGSSGGAGGSLTKIGTGTLTLTGINTYTGATTVNAGSLIVDGSIASAQTLVNAGGLLGGHGSLGGSLVNSGIVSPGDSPGTLTVIGNYTQNAGGTLRIEVAGLAPSQYDLLAVNGHASLAGTLQLIGLSGFKLHVGNQVTFLTANGGVSGSFGTVQNQLATGTLVKVQVVDLPNSVVLEGTQGSFVEGACNPNSVAVAQALNSAVGNPRASTLIAFLDDQPLNNLCGDYTLIAPEELASIFNAGVSLANVQTANLIRRMEDIRAGSTGFSSSGFTLNGSAPNFSGGFAGVSGPEGKSGPSVMTPTPENRWGVWVTGIGEFTTVDSTNIAAGYDIQSGGVTLGVDYRFTSYFAIGLTAGYANINADLPNGGSLDVNAGQLGFYSTVFGSGFYADAAVTGGPSGYDSRRAALLGSANGNTDGGNFNVLIAAGYDWQKGGLSIGPTANFQYSYVGVTSFTESGSLAPLKIPSQNAESERTAFGMKASYDWKVGHVIIRPELSLAWQHEFGDQSYSIVSSFANGAGNSFTVNSPQVGRDSLLIGAGAAVLLNDRVSLYAYYDGEQLRTNYHSNSVSVGVRMTF